MASSGDTSPRLPGIGPVQAAILGEKRVVEPVGIAREAASLDGRVPPAPGQPLRDRVADPADPRLGVEIHDLRRGA